MTNKDVTPLTKKQQNKLIRAVNKAITQAEQDTGLDPSNYGMLEERIRWYLDIIKFDIGYLLDIKFHYEKYYVEITQVQEITTTLDKEL